MSDNSIIDVVGYEEGDAKSFLRSKGITIRKRKILIPPNSEKQIKSGLQPRIVRQFINEGTCEITIGYFLK